MKSQAPHNQRAHSKIGASSSERWINCPGSVALCETVPKAPDNEASAKGTAAHELLEVCLITGTNARDHLGKVFNKCKAFPNGFKVDSDMIEAVQVAVDHVRNTLKQYPGAELLVEKKFKLSHIHPDLYGTSDIIIRVHFLKLIVMDYKHGEGHVVEVEDNPQLKIYGLGAAFEDADPDFGEVELHILQPRAWHEDGPIRKWTIDFEELVQWGKVLRQKALETEKKNAKLEKGEWCRWCNAAPVCPKMREAVIATAKLDFKTDEPKLPAVEKLTDEQIVRVMENQNMIVNWMKSVKDFALLRMMNGEKIKGLKLVKGKGFRTWGDEEVVIEKFGNKIYTKKMMTVAQAEKKLGKDVVKQFVQSIEGGVTIAHESDRRRAVVAAKDDFTKVTFENEGDF